MLEFFSCFIIFNVNIFNSFCIIYSKYLFREVAMKKKKFSTKDNTALHMLSNINCNNTQHNHATNHVIVADKSSNSNSSNNISKSNDNVGTMTKNNRTSAKGESKTNNIINRALSFLKMTKQGFSIQVSSFLS